MKKITNDDIIRNKIAIDKLCKEKQAELRLSDCVNNFYVVKVRNGALIVGSYEFLKIALKKLNKEFINRRFGKLGLK